jgi:hypothetical protein
MPTAKRGAGSTGARKRGRPLGSASAEASEYLALRVPLRLLVPFRERWGRGLAARLRDLMERDLEPPPPQQ